MPRLFLSQSECRAALEPYAATGLLAFSVAVLRHVQPDMSHRKHGPSTASLAGCCSAFTRARHSERPFRAA